jgi:hypothetical protein
MMEALTMRSWSKFLVIAIAFAVLCAAARAASPPPITVTIHGSNPVGGAGTCPYTELFNGSIHGPVGAAITYRFERSTGNEETHKATIPASGVKSVVDTWTRHVSGEVWEQLHVLTPTDVTSEKVTFHPRCPGGSV